MFTRYRLSLPFTACLLLPIHPLSKAPGMFCLVPGVLRIRGSQRQCATRHFPRWAGKGAKVEMGFQAE